MGRHRTDEEKRALGEKARELRANGRSRREIRSALGISDELAKALLHDVPVPDNLRRPRAKDAQRAAAVEMRRNGATYDQIAAELGVSKSSCSLWLRGVARGEQGDDHEQVRRGPTPEEAKAKAALRRAEARRLRGDGLVLAEIAEQLGVSVKTIYYDTLGLPVPPRGRPKGRSPEELKAAQRAYWERERARRQALRARAQEAAANAVGPLTREELHLLAVTAYWCEGSKSKPYEIREQVTFINSDIGLIRLWLAYLDDINFPDEHRNFSLSIHASADLEAAHRSWAEDLGLPETCFSKPVIKRHNPKTVRRNTGEQYRGCLIVRLRQCADLYRHIAGTWAGIMDGLPATRVRVGGEAQSRVV